MDIRILVTLGPSSLSEETVKRIARHDIYLFRINLSHTPLEAVAETIAQVEKWSKIPVCIDSEGAQIRNQSMNGHPVKFETGEAVRIHFDDIAGDANNVSLTPPRGWPVNWWWETGCGSISMRPASGLSSATVATVWR